MTAVLEAVAVGALPPSTSRWRSGLPSLPKEGRVSESHPLVEEGEAGRGEGRRERGGEEGNVSDKLHIPSYTFIYLYIPVYTFIYLQIT